tara:strand:+ start:40 stop:198 length:159 start_codon:yes stop_codon:yes gene_type:complete
MKVKILSPLKVRGKKSGLYNYQYFDSLNNPISAIFQDTKTNIKKLQNEFNNE